ncbi:MAG TPA: tail fiber domain-containing protein [Verrucomicrobiae bacterium]|nr:tail fiber domain-containing protein [Verrucomicrobiae bacterium]
MKILNELVFAALLSAAINFESHGQGTGFTYQGRLSAGGVPANGVYDLTFSLFQSDTGGVSVAGPITNSATGVTNGLFTVLLDFGSIKFDGLTQRLQIGVRTNGNGSFTSLSPRQQITAVPYAVSAENLLSVVQLNNLTPGVYSAIGGGIDNAVTSYYALVGGGYNNTNSGYAATIGGGARNFVDEAYVTIAGGIENRATGNYATVGGGDGNIASNEDSTVSGGFQNVASGGLSTVPGGGFNVASGDYSLAAGYDAQAVHSGSFVWNDGSGGSFSSTAPNQFSVRAAGGIELAGDVAIEGGASAYHHLQMGGGNSLGFLYGSYPGLGDGIHLGYNWYADSNGGSHIINAGGGTSRISANYGEIVLAVGAANTAPSSMRLVATTAGVSVFGTFNNNSDRNAKQDFAPISPSQILDKVLQLPLCEWSYKVDAATRHIGPMAQDFSSVFKVGTDDKHIAPIDEGGVALAAIQGLNQKLNDKDAQVQNLEKRLNELQALVKQLAERK